MDNPQLTKAQKYLSPNQKKLVQDGAVLIESTKQHLSGKMNDYSFLVAPFAKAYEGFLKDFFLKIDLIDLHLHRSDHFRVGKTLNPSLRYKRFSIYQRLADLDPKGELLAEKLWHAWKNSRNEIFHWFPHNLKNLSLPEAIERANLILNVIDETGLFLNQNPIGRKYRS